jgi:hypothetical protein
LLRRQRLRRLRMLPGGREILTSGLVGSRLRGRLTSRIAGCLALAA